MEKYKNALKTIFTVTNDILNKLDYSKTLAVFTANGCDEEVTIFLNNISKLQNDFLEILQTLKTLPEQQRVFLTILFYAFKKEEVTKKSPDINNVVHPFFFEIDEIKEIFDAFNTNSFVEMSNLDNLLFLREHYHTLEFFIIAEKEKYDLDDLDSKINDPKAKEKIKWIPTYIVSKKFGIVANNEESDIIVRMIDKGINITGLRRTVDGAPIRIKYKDDTVIKRSAVLSDMIENDEIVLETKNATKARGILRKML